MSFHLDSPSAGPAEIAQFLDEHHLVVVGDDDARQRELVRALAAHLEAIADAEVIWIDGAAVTDLKSFMGELERGLRTGQPTFESIADVVAALRSAPHNPRHQFFIWEHADELVERDPTLFGRLANAFFGVAAEREHITPGPLVLQRVVFVGGASLRTFAGTVDGPFRSWLIEDEAKSFWEMASCVPRPAVLTYEV